MLAWLAWPVSTFTVGILRIDIEDPYLALYAVVAIVGLGPNVATKGIALNQLNTYSASRILTELAD